MHVRVLLAVVVAIVLEVLASPAPAHAESEKAKTNQSTKLYRRAGEQSPVILTLVSGQTVTVIAKDGRWLRVRVSGRTGWIPRSKVDLPDGDDDIMRNTRRQPFVGGRGTKRGFGGETGPQDRVGADATDEGDQPPPRGEKPSSAAPAGKPTPADDAEDDDGIRVEDDASSRTKAGSGDAVVVKEPVRPTAHVSKATKVHDKPESDGGEVFTADKKMVLYVARTKGNWTRVSNDEGDAGWVLSSELDIDEAEVPAAGGKRATAIEARGRFGFTFVNQSLATPGGVANGPPDNYSAGSPAITIALGASVLRPLASRYWLGGELGYDFNKAFLGGITYQNQTTSFTYHSLNLRVAAGYDLQTRSGMVVFARLGYHFDSFQVADVADFTKNTAKVPSQIIQAPTLGAALAIPRLSQKLGATLSLDTIFLGSSVSQTKNLEDGTKPDAKGAFLGLGVVYRWKPKMDLQFRYDLSYIAVSFGGMPPETSVRGHTGTGPSSGSDLNNALSAGIAYAF